MKPRLPNQRAHGSAARMFGLFFGGLVLAGLLLLAMVTVLKKKGASANRPPQTENGFGK
jgi:hypothetical protein